MRTWVKIAGPAVAALLVASPLGLPSAAAASASVPCRNVHVSNPTGGAHVDGRLCWTSVGGGYFSMTWNGTVHDTRADGAGAAAQVKYTTPGGVDSHAYRTDGLGTSLSFRGGAEPGKGLYMRACLINGDSVHDCSAWQ